MPNSVYKEQTLDVSKSFGYGLIYKPVLTQPKQFILQIRDSLRRYPHPTRRFKYY